jgi:hypothetical protein
MTKRDASCSCGQLRLEVDGYPIRVTVCHCLACQKRTGSTYGAQGLFDRDKVTVEGSSSEYLRVGDEGCQVSFHFCPRCGATVYYFIDQFTDYVAIPVGVFADPDFPPPVFSIYEARKHAWVSVPADTRHAD